MSEPETTVRIWASEGGNQRCGDTLIEREIDRLTAERDELRNECERLQRIVDAAMAVRSARDCGLDAEEALPAWEALKEAVRIGSFITEATDGTK